MLPRTAIKQLQMCEKQFPVSQWRFNGFWLWPIFRLRVEALTGLSFEKKQSTEMTGATVQKSFWGPLTAAGTVMHESSWGQKVFSFLIHLMHVFRGFKRLVSRSAATGPKSRRLVLALSGGPHTQTGGKLFDNNLSPIGEWLEKLDTDLQVLSWKKLSSPCVFPTVEIIETLNDCYHLATFTWRFRGWISKPALPGYDEVVAFLKEQGVCESNIPSRERLLFEALRIEIASRYFDDVISNHSPAAVFTTCYYNEWGLSLNLAAWRRKIPTTDIQHGCQGHLHAAYSNWNALPGDGDDTCCLLSDNYICWTPEEAHVIESWRGPGTAHSVGPPIMTAWEEMSDRLSPAREEGLKILSAISTTSNAQIILVTLWPLRADEDHFLEIIRQAFERFPEAAWWFRLHPSQQGDSESVSKLRTAFGSSNKIEIENTSRIPLPSLLNAADVLITRFSSTIMEASAVGLPSIAIDEFGSALYEGVLGPQQSVFFAFSVEELVQKITSVTSIHRRTVDFNPVSISLRLEVLSNLLVQR